MDPAGRRTHGIRKKGRCNRHNRPSHKRSAYVRTEIYATKEELDEVRDIAEAAHVNADMAMGISTAGTNRTHQLQWQQFNSLENEEVSNKSK